MINSYERIRLRKQKHTMKVEPFGVLCVISAHSKI